MHTALLTGGEYLRNERGALRSLMIGMLDEGVRVTRIVPTGADPPGGDLAGPVMHYRPRGTRAWPKRRIAGMADRLDEQGVSLLHAVDSDTWLLAVALGEMMDLPILLSSHDRYDARLTPKLFRTLNPTRCMMAADTEPMAQLLRDAVNNLVVVETIPPGVHLSDQTPRERTPDDPLCVVLSTDGPLDEDYLAALEGLNMFASTHPGAQCFVHGDHPDSHQVYKQARRIGVLGHLSFVPNGLDVGELLLRADAVLHPQAIGKTRGITLLAMGAAVPVLAVEDDVLDYLVHDHTCWLTEPTAQAWADRLEYLVADPEAGAQLGRRAQAWVREDRLASDHLARMVNLYRQLAGEPIAFPG